MSATNTCSTCGDRVPADAPLGLCPRCLMGAAAAQTASEPPPASRQPTISREELLRVIQELDLVPAEILAAVEEDDPSRFAQALVRAKALTPYQAGALLGGKARGLLIGSYLVESKLGAGGMGLVLKARHRPSGQIVALKMLPPSFGREPDTVRRFRREFQIASRLSHPNVVAAIEASEDRGIHYLTMEYIPGYDLDTLVARGGPMTLKLALHCAIQIARGLEAAHAQGIVHRDVKPGNVMIDPNGVVRLLDLGLARVIQATTGFGAQSTALTQTGSYMGTVDFLAPEQADNAKAADARADVYSLACTLYFLLTASPPFAEGTILKRMMAHQNHPAPSLRAARPEVPEALDAIYLKMMAKRPGDRPQSMSEVILALESCRTSAREAGDASAALKTFAHTIMKRAPENKPRSPHTSIFARPAPQIDGPSLDPNLCFEDLVADYREEIHHEPLAKAKLPPRTPGSRPTRKTSHQRIHPALIGLAVMIVLVALRYVLLPRRDWSRPIERSEIGFKPKLEIETDPAPPAGFAASIGITIMPIPSGEFWMGMSPEETEAAKEENPKLTPDDYATARPRHRVRITRLQGLSAHEITIGQFRRFVEDTGYRPVSERDGKTSTGYNPDTWELVRNAKITWKDDGFHPSDNHPVTCVSWNDATEFCLWLSRKDGRTYRLPTEAEWEYCCRAGSESLFSNGNYQQESMVTLGNVADAMLHAKLPNTPALDGDDGYVSTAPVGRFEPNAWGLYDMHGNVWEWCQDFHDATYYATSPPTDPPGPASGKARIVRGGSWVDIGVPSAARNPISPGFLIANIGFRVALDQPMPPAPMAMVTEPEPEPEPEPAPMATAPERENVLLSEDFNTPDPAWKQSGSEDIAANHGAGFANGAWFVTSNGEAQYSWHVPGGPYPEIEVEFAVKVLGDGNPDPRGGALIHLFSDMPGQAEDRTERGIQLRINSAGQLVLEPSFWTATTYPNGPWRGPINHPALKPAGQTNVLKLRIHTRQLELFANGQQVGEPIPFDWDLTPARLSLGADSWTGTIRAEFDRIEIRKRPPTTDPAPAPKPPSNVLLSENFDAPKPTWQQSGPEEFANNWGCGFANGAWFAMSNTDAQYSWPVPGGPYPEIEVEFAVKVTGDGNSDPRGGGLIHLFTDVPGQTGDKAQRGIQLRINGAGQLVLEPSFWTAKTYPNGPWRGPINHPALKPAGQTNILKLRIHKRQLELFANNRRVGAPILFDWDLTPARLSLGADSWTGTIRAEFDRFEIRELNPPPG